jgi:WD40 repeat protein/energy-coupling factor transporter ATP-binding protein EcfA2
MSGSSPRGVFAERFALLYAEAGDPPLKRVTESVARARRTDEKGRAVLVPAQRVSDWRRGRNVPARFSALVSVLEVLIGEARKARPTPSVPGLYDTEAWRELWEKAVASPVDPAPEGTPPEKPQESGACPYRGLASFRPEDSAWFFGRERSTTALVARLDGALDTGGIVVLVGASGAGKSSLMRAGLLPAIAGGALEGSASWSAVLMSPGADPLKELVGRIPELDDVLERGDEGFAEGVRAAVAAHAGGGRLVVVVDQFEEAFTLCGDENRLRTFVQALHAACTGQNAPALVVLGVRADFYGRCLDHPELAEALQDRQMVLGPMTATELREAVNRPAKAAGLQLEAGLVELVLRDLGVHGGRTAAYDAGALPLLSHAMLATWQRRQAGKLTISGYRAAGGIHGAVAATAERAWADLDAAGQIAARPLLLRLVRVGDDTRDTRRRSTRQELVDQATNAAATEDALEVLARARLVTLDAGSVEITHEALLQAWPRLRSWIDQDRAGNLLRQRLEEDASAWAAAERDSSLLYRGARLETARQWADTAGPAGLTALAQDFVAASTHQRRRSTWGRRAAVAAVAVFALIAATAAVAAVNQRDDARFSQIVAEADRVQDTDPSLSAQLNLVARDMRPDDEDVRARLLSTQHSALATPLKGHTGAVYLTSFSPDGRTLATASYDNTARLWDISDRSRPKPIGGPLTGHKSWVSSAVFSPDGRTLATAGDDKTVRLWDVSDRSRPRPLGGPLTGDDGTIYLVAFSPDGRTLATANEHGTARLWDVADPAKPVALGEPLRGHASAVRSVAFSPDGHTLATTGDDRTIRLWNVTDPAKAEPLGQPLTGHDSTVHSVAFSPDGRTLASGSDDRTTRLWDVGDLTRPTPLGAPLTGHTAAVWSVVFSRDGRMLVSGSADGTARLWNVASPAHATQVGQPLAAHGNGVFAVGISPDGQTVATGSGDNVARLWSLPSTVLLGHSAAVKSPAFSPDGRILATGGDDTTVRLWNVADPLQPSALGRPLTGHTGYVHHIAFRPDGRVLATGSGDRTVRLWDITDPAEPKPLGEPITLNTRYTDSVTFSPDGHLLATGNDDNSVRLWDVRDPAAPEPVGQPLLGHTGYVNQTAFSPDGHVLATASSDKTVRLWDVTDPAAAKPLGAPLTGHAGDVQDLEYTPDGDTLATASTDKTVRLWDVRDPAKPKPVGGPLTGHTEAVVSVAFSADGHTLATGSADTTIRLWDVTDPARSAPSGQVLTGHVDTAYSLAFSPSGQFLATASGDNAVRLWDLDPEHAAARICATTRGVLTPEEWQQHLPRLPYDEPCR